MTESPNPEAVELAHRLFDCAREGDNATLETYVDAGVPVELTDSGGNTLLMLAAYNGQLGVVRTLIARGADVDRCNDRGQSPLAGVIFKGEDEIVAALLASGADPDLGTPSARETADMFDRSELLDGS